MRDALRVRPLRHPAWRHHRNLRPARDCERHGRSGHPLFPGGEPAHGDGHPRPALLVRALDRHGDVRRHHWLPMSYLRMKNHLHRRMPY